MVQIVLPGGGITTLDEHEVNSFPDKSGVTLPSQPMQQDPADVDPYLVTVKQDEPSGTQ